MAATNKPAAWPTSLYIYIILGLAILTEISSGQQAPLRERTRQFRQYSESHALQQPVVENGISGDSSSRNSKLTYMTEPLHLTTTERLRGDQRPPKDIDGGLLFDRGSISRHRHVEHHLHRSETYFHIMRARPTYAHPCEQSSCYPATGNLLIGRENRLSATSTCGTEQPQRYCIVSHLEQTKCFLCDTRPQTAHDPLKNHRVGHIIYEGHKTWWQSENGRENVSIQLNMEAEFHFTHMMMTFQTFRPAAMLIERSYDFGKTWHVYKYFAANCRESFPHAPMHSKNVTDVICMQRYSDVEPSKNGEVIMRVLPPNMNIENPYAEHIQNMLKMTNLRVNFTKLHTLGDNLLDDRHEIREKYYYAISSMVVRGSCSCYGHASQCLPLDNIQSNERGMVHGRCECTHNTKGLNCEECEDFFNDLPWKPAFGKQTNACKKCNCNNHASSCHFDHAVYEHSGRISGGVCDNCQHNTQGQHCEECIPFFYKDPAEDIQSPYMCKPCDCDPRGALDEGICDSISDTDSGLEAGSCHCKVNVKGRRCDYCKDGYWNLDESTAEGCQNCTCNTLGTSNNSGCNMYTGECTCKRLVTGKDCNQCMVETYGLSDSQDGCSPCDCDLGGSLDNNCDVMTGQCKCRPHMAGRTCSAPMQNYFVPVLHHVFEAEIPEITFCGSSYGNCSIVTREPPIDRLPSWTGPGFVRATEGTDVVFQVDDVPHTMPYDVIIRYNPESRGDWEVAYITLIRPDSYDPEGPCANADPYNEQRKQFLLREYDTQVVALNDVCLEQGKMYKFKIVFTSQRASEESPSAQILIDSLVLIPHIEVTPIFRGSVLAHELHDTFNRYGCNDSYYRLNYDRDAPKECQDVFRPSSTIVANGAQPCNCNPTGSVSKRCEEYGGYCQCKNNVVGRQCDKCEPGTYAFGPEGCKACDCSSIGAKDNDCDLVTGQCNCVPNAYGRECDQCLPGFWNFPECRMCECNGHAQTCDSGTGECHSCQDFTAGANCDRCVEGYYGNPYLGSDIGCRACRCPDTVASGHFHSEGCSLDARSNDMVCHCQEGYTGARCDVCADNYFGNPEIPGGTCQKCDCSNNIDPYQTGNCDAKTGKCMHCLYNTDGDHCEYCKNGYHGDALEHTCRQCDCDLLGTNSTIEFCDRYTGQCPCLKNVHGLRCDTCADNHWKIARGEGCDPCDCDPIGAVTDQCNPYDGQCECQKGFGGRQCDQCEQNYFGDPNVQCHECQCDYYGSASQQCDRLTGQCVCKQGMGGFKCEQCDRGYLGQAPYCSPCGECFDNWDLILDNIKEDTQRVIAEAKQIKTVGATGAYTKDFDAMAHKLDRIQALLQNATISGQDIKELDDKVKFMRDELNSAVKVINGTEQRLDQVYSSINLAEVELDDLKNRSALVNQYANELKMNATQLQEANIEGALNLTREAWNRVQMLEETEQRTVALVNDAERQCKRVETLRNRTDDKIESLLASSMLGIDKYRAELAELVDMMPDMNEKMCDKRGDPCDNLCGGAGCDSCGGLSCEKGAYTRAEKALGYAKDTEKLLKEKEEQAEELIRSLSQAKTNATEAWRRANKIFGFAEGYFNDTSEFIKLARNAIVQLTDVINNNTASPEEIQRLTDETLASNLKLDPEEIKDLARRINEVVKSLVNVDNIIIDTKTDLDNVRRLKERANHAKQEAEAVLAKAKDVVEALNAAEDAQNKANDAINKANQDINLAKSDLEQIDGQTGDASKKATDTAKTVDGLSAKLGDLRKKLTKNDLDAKDIRERTEHIKDTANNAHDLASKLRNQYKTANSSLALKAKTSESARERATQLLQRASRITVETTGKLRDLKDMTDIYNTNDHEIEKMEEKITRLNDEMAHYVQVIQSRADGYRQCTS